VSAARHAVSSAEFAHARRKLAAVFGGISPDFVLDSPFVLLGTHAQVAETIAARRQRFGVSYWTVFDELPRRPSAIPDIAKVIASLR
jgi:hypothetical protein